MKKTEPQQSQNQPSETKDQLNQPTQDKLSQDVLNDEELEEVNGGSAGFATGRRIYKPIRIETPVGTASP